jgi:tetratricopeptide (TPR) repeat protein
LIPGLSALTLREIVARIPASLQEDSLSGRFKCSLYAALFALSAELSMAQNQTPVALDTNETLFTVLTAINSCGYDQELGVSDPLRAQVRSQVALARQKSQEASDAADAMCKYYQEHQTPDASKALSQYVSLALYLNPPPALTTKVKEADMPPDATIVVGILPFMQKFSETVALHDIWEANRQAYSALPARYHEPLAKMLFDTEIYLKIPSSIRLGRGFTVYVDPMGAPGQTNARNYGSDYFVVISPGPGSGLKMDQIRHTYLHYLLDPMAMKYPATMKRLSPLLENVKAAPMDQSFKTDPALLVTECLIRAIEARTARLGKAPEAERLQVVQNAARQGFVLTPYFYEALIRFEKDPAGLTNAYGDLVSAIDIGKEKKRASQVTFASTSDKELLQLSRPQEGKLLITAEQRLSAGDTDSAQKLAQQALQEKNEDQGRALFILAEVATHKSDMQGARNYFEQALEVAHEPKVVAWSHIYLGRIYDLQEDRGAAMDHYRAAVTASAELPEAKAAAELGLQKPYEPTRRSQ